MLCLSDAEGADEGKELIGMPAAAMIPFALAAAALILSIRHFRQKGFLLNNAWLYASPEEREKLNTAPWYRQTAICMLGISLLFTAVGLYAITGSGLFPALEGLLVAALLVYAIGSTRAINKETQAAERPQP